MTSPGKTAVRAGRTPTDRLALPERITPMRRLLGSILVLFALGGTGLAQDLDFTLYPGFWPDPYRVSYLSGGEVDAGWLNDAYGYPCAGWIAGVPDHVMTLTQSFEFLRIYAQSGGDVTLVLYNPATGDRFCDDDGYGNGQPEIVMDYISAGDWWIYVGSYWRDDMHRYDLTVTEFSSDFAGGRAR